MCEKMRKSQKEKKKEEICSVNVSKAASKVEVQICVMVESKKVEKRK